VRAVVQTVGRASVTVDGEVVGEIGEGLLVLLGVTHSDGATEVQAMARKVHELRILDDERSAAETGVPLLVVSQFTLYADTRKGRRAELVGGGPGGDRRTAGHGVRHGAAGARRLRGHRPLPGSNAGRKRKYRTTNHPVGGLTTEIVPPGSPPHPGFTPLPAFS